MVSTFSNLEDGVEYTGMIEDSADVPQTHSENANDSQTDALVTNESEVGAINGEGSNKLSAEFKFEYPKNKDDEEISASVSGKVNIELKNSAKLYIAQDRQYVEVKFDYSLGLNFSIKMEVDAKIPLGKFSFAPIPGLKIGLTPNVVLKSVASNLIFPLHFGFDVRFVTPSCAEILTPIHPFNFPSNESLPLTFKTRDRPYK